MTKIITKHGSGEPSPSDLDVAEIALDADTGDMYTKLDDTRIKKLNDIEIRADLETETAARIAGDEYLDERIYVIEGSIAEGGGFVEAPRDGEVYARRGDNSSWVRTYSKEYIDETYLTDALWKQDGSNIYYDTGLVGIGKTPVNGDGKLQVGGAGKFDDRVTATSVNLASGYTAVNLFNSGGTYSSSVVYNNDQFLINANDDNNSFKNNIYKVGVGVDGATFHEWKVGPVAAMKINSAGNVGIGVDNPRTELNIAQASNSLSSGIRFTGASLGSSWTIAKTDTDGSQNLEFAYSGKNSTNPASWACRVTSGGHLWSKQGGHFRQPDDYWATTGWYSIGSTSALASSASGDMILTAGGYRKKDDKWQSLAGAAGAAQIQLKSGNGVINFRSDSAKADDSVNQATIRMQILGSGEVGIGMTPVAATAAAQLANWKSELDVLLEDNPELEVKAAVRQATDDAFEVMPTEEIVAEWMETRAAGDRLQVNGNISATGNISAAGSISATGNIIGGGELLMGVKSTFAQSPDDAGKGGFYHSAEQGNADGWPYNSGPASLLTLAGNNANNYVQLVFPQNTPQDPNFRRKRSGNASDWQKFQVRNVNNRQSFGEGNSSAEGADGPQSTMHLRQPSNNSAGGFKLTRAFGTSQSFTQFVNASNELVINYADGKSESDTQTEVFKITSGGNIQVPGTTTLKGKTIVNINENGGTALEVKNSNSTSSHGIKITHGGNGTGTFPLLVETTGGSETFKLDGQGNGIFKGTVTSTNTRSDLIIQDGSPVIDAKGLISTLSTLRNATKDETTLEGMRDALSDAIGGLIEKFEHEIATMPAPEPEVSTMPAGDEA